MGMSRSSQCICDPVISPVYLPGPCGGGEDDTDTGGSTSKHGEQQLPDTSVILLMLRQSVTCLREYIAQTSIGIDTWTNDLSKMHWRYVTSFRHLQVTDNKQMVPDILKSLWNASVRYSVYVCHLTSKWPYMDETLYKQSEQVHHSLHSLLCALNQYASHYHVTLRDAEDIMETIPDEVQHPSLIIQASEAYVLLNSMDTDFIHFAINFFQMLNNSN